MQHSISTVMLQQRICEETEITDYQQSNTNQKKINLESQSVTYSVLNSLQVLPVKLTCWMATMRAVIVKVLLLIQ